MRSVHQELFERFLQYLGWHQEQTHLPAGWKYQHDTPVYEEEPELPIMGGLRTSAWVDSQLRQLGGHLQSPHPGTQHTGAMTPIPATPGDTGAIQQLALPAPRRSPKTINGPEDAPTAKKLPGLPQHVREKIRDGLPILRQERANPAHVVPDLVPEPANVVEEFDPLATLLPERFRTPAVPPMPDLEPDPFGFADLPTWIAPSTIDQRVEDVISRSGKLQDDSWLTADPPTLVPLPDDVIATSDRTAVTLFADAITIHQVAEDDEPTLEHERTIANKSFMQAINSLKAESE